MKFRPVVSPAYRVTDQRLTEHPDAVRAAAREFIDDLHGGDAGADYEQSAWMGRGCARMISDDLCLLGKGVGPGPGSEQMRQFLDRLLRAEHSGSGACLRLDTGAFYPLLLQHSWDDRTTTVLDPRPEGMSIYGATLREYHAERIAATAGVPTVQSVALLRHRVTAPWMAEQISVEQYITRSVGADQRFLHGRPPRIVQVQVVHSDYHDMDAGLLIRSARTPYRVQNLYQAALDEDAASFQSLRAEARRLWDEPPLTRLARCAALLFTAGLIHGQLRTHYQNVSLAGELADFDSLICTRSSPLARNLSDLDAERGLSMAQFYDADHRRGTSSPDVQGAAELGQIYDLWNIGLRVTDLMARDAATMLAPGSVLSKPALKQARQEFAGEMRVHLSAADRRRLGEIWAASGGQPLAAYLDKRSDVSIYGWHRQGAQLNHFGRPHADADHWFVVDDARHLLCELLSPRGSTA